MNSSETGFGVIGCGTVAKRKFLPALMKCEQARIVACASKSFESAQQASEKFGGEPMPDLESLLSRKDVDAVYIATPIAAHTEIALRAAKQGKHILCEKSLASTLNDVEKIVYACRENNVALLEGFMYQFHSQHAFIRDKIEEGVIGAPVLFQAWFGFPPLPADNFRYDKSLGGGVLLDAGGYVVHAARKFFDSETVAVSAYADVDENGLDIRYSIMLDFGEHKKAMLACGFDNFYKNTYSVWGTAGQITGDRAFSIPENYAPKIFIERQDYGKIHTLKPCDQFLEEIKIFCQNIDNPKMQEQWRKDALNQALVLEKIRKITHYSF